MQRKFITNLFLLLLLNLLIKPFWILGIDRTVQNVVGSESYGLYYALLNFSFLLNILLDIGITNFNNRNIAQHQHLLSKHLSGISMLKLLLGGFYLVVTLIGGFFLGYQSGELWFLVLLGINQFLASFILYMRSSLSGLLLFRTDSILSVLDKAVMIIICGLLLWGNLTTQKFRIEWFVYAQTGSYFLVAAIAFMLVLFRTKSFRPKLNLAFSLMILRKSIPFAVLILLMTSYTRIDAVMIERMLPEGALYSGIYAQGYRLLDATNMIAFLFAGLLLPIFSKMTRTGESVEELVKLSVRLLLAPALLISVSCFFYRQELMDLMYLENIHESTPVFGLLMICFIPVSMTYIFGTLLTANGNLKTLNIMALGGLSLNLGLNFILIPRFFALGAAISSLLTQVMMAVAQIIIVQYFFRFKPDYHLLKSTVLFIIGLLAIGFGIIYMEMDGVVSFFMMISMGVIWSFLSGIINIRSLYQIVKYETRNYE